MATRLDKIDVQFTEVRLSTVLDEADGVTLHYWVNIGYQVITSQGELINRQFRMELSGGPKTTATNMFTNAKTAIKAQEGIP